MSQPDLELGLWVPLAEPDRDPPELCVTTCRDDDGVSRALVHHRPHERTRGQLGQRCPFSDGSRRLRRGHRLPGQDRLVALEVGGGEQPQVGRHDRADFEVHHVARDEMRDFDATRNAVARRRHEMTDVRVHRLGGPFGPELVHEPEADGGTEDDPDDEGVHTLADER